MTGRDKQGDAGSQESASFGPVDALPLPHHVPAEPPRAPPPPVSSSPARRYRVTGCPHWLKGVGDKSSRWYAVDDIVEYVGEVSAKLVPVDETPSTETF